MKTTKITMLLLSAAILVASCNKDERVSPPSQNKTVTLTNSVKQERLEIISQSIGTKSSRTSSYIGDVIVETYPGTPSGTDVRDISIDGVDASWGNDSYSALVVPAGGSYSGAIAFGNGIDVYVEGELTLPNSGSWGSGTIYVAEGGSVTFASDYVLSDLVVKSWGALLFEGDFSTVKTSTTTALYNYSATDAITVNGTLQVNTNFESLGAISAKELDIVGADASDTPRTVKLGGCVNVEYLNISNYAEVYLSNIGVVAEVFDLHSYSNVYLTGSTLITVNKELNFENRSSLTNLSSEYAVVDATKGVITVDENSYLARINGGPVDLNYTNLVDDQSNTAVEWAANVVFNKNTYIAPNGCHGGHGDKNEGGTDEPVLEHDAVVTSPDIERISATSIDFKDNVVFVSWHEAEANYQGYIDVVDMSDLSIKATLHTYDYDFNHMYINNGTAYVTGGEKAGAFYSEIKYATDAATLDIEVKRVGGASGNCITIDGTNKWIVSGSNGGVTVANANNEQIYTELAEAKFVEPFNGGMAVLAGISNSYIHEYDLSGSLKSSYEVGSIAPLDGKNTLHEDGNTIYACLSKGGLVAYSNGEKVGYLEENIVGSVNCVDTDNNYIYIANGTKGLTIVDKASWKEVKSYKLGDASANYVKLGKDGYIYVAYGLKGVHRFKLIN